MSSNQTRQVSLWDEERHETTEAKTEAMKLQAKEHQGIMAFRNQEESRKDFFPL